MKFKDLEEEEGRVARRRWGLDGCRPHGIAELADIQGTTVSSMQRQLHRLEACMRTSTHSTEVEIDERTPDRFDD